MPLRACQRLREAEKANFVYDKNALLKSGRQKWHEKRAAQNISRQKRYGAFSHGEEQIKLEIKRKLGSINLQLSMHSIIISANKLKMSRGNSHEEDESSEFYIEKSTRKSLPQNRYLRWSTEQNINYAKFLLKYSQKFQGMEARKSSMIFNKMSSELKNGRNNHQCRSHHVKLISKFGDIAGIIFNILYGEKTKKKTKESTPQPKSLSKQARQAQTDTQDKVVKFQLIDELETDREESLFQSLAGPNFCFL